MPMKISQHSDAYNHGGWGWGGGVGGDLYHISTTIETRTTRGVGGGGGDLYHISTTIETRTTRGVGGGRCGGGGV